MRARSTGVASVDAFEHYIDAIAGHACRAHARAARTVGAVAHPIPRCAVLTVRSPSSARAWIHFMVKAEARLDERDQSGSSPGVPDISVRRLDGLDAGSGGGVDVANHGVDPVSIALGVFEALEHHAGRAFAGNRFVCARTQGIRGEQRSQVAIQVHGTGERDIEFALLQRVYRHLQGAQAGGLLAGDAVTWSADVKFARDAAGDDAAKRAKRAVGAQGRTRAVAQARDPLIRCGAPRIEPRLARPLGGAPLHRPAEMEIGGAQIEAEADEDAAARWIELRIACVIESGFRNVEHEKLLRQHLRHLARCNVKALDRNGQVVEEIPRKTTAPYAADFFAAQAAPILALLWFLVGAAVQHALLKRFQVRPAAHSRRHANYRDRFRWGNCRCGLGA